MTLAPSKYGTPEARWAGVGPYYAMFPTSFADEIIGKYTEEGDTILDPFAGRGTSLYSAACKNRHAIGIEINPVGWIYAATKLAPAQRWRVEARAEEIGKRAKRFGSAVNRMPEFYHWCFDRKVLAFLLAARRYLNWRNRKIDRSLMTILLVDLHGKRELAFSNQMRQTKALSPNYAVNWWRDRNMRPLKRDPLEHVFNKIAWRYAKGRPCLSESKVFLADSSMRHSGLRTLATRIAPNGIRLLFTSPPYLGVTNYHYDQWLRLWLLGGPALPKALGDPNRGKFQHPSHFKTLLEKVFSQAKQLLAKNAFIYVRTDKRSSTKSITENVLKEIFPQHRMRRIAQPMSGKSQTALFRNKSSKLGELDIVLTPK